jgi:single-strand DNA-binding protein
MNKVILMGRLVAEPEIRVSGETTVARYRLAVDKAVKPKKEGEPTADFISCVAFNKRAEFAEKYLHKGTKIVVEGSLLTGSYTDKEGKKIYTTDVVVNAHYFCESRSAEQSAAEPKADANGFMAIPDNVEDDGLPF